MLKHMFFDKKVFNGEIRLILLDQIGKAIIHKLEQKKEMQLFLKKELL